MFYLMGSINRILLLVILATFVVLAVKPWYNYWYMTAPLPGATYAWFSTVARNC